MSHKNSDASWQSILVCPIDRDSLEVGRCAACGFQASEVIVGGKSIVDLRALDRPQTVTISVDLPVVALDRSTIARTMFRAVHEDFPHFSRREVRRRFGTKLDKGIQYYCQMLLREKGTDARILDLGCGSGGNRRYLETLGFKHILCVDWYAQGADYLVDAHRLPIADSTFDMVISTAVFEHLYQPLLAMREIARICRPDALFVGGASFWEAWHGSSYFHLTPDGWNALFTQSGFTWIDLWPGWGIVPAALTHVLTPGHLRGFGLRLQSIVEAAYRLAMGEQGVRRLQLRASGSYQVCARKAAWS